MTDAIGVRVITSYAHGVADVVDRLKNKFTIDGANSIDKRQLLDTGSFGYRSVHLVLETGRTGVLDVTAKILESTKIEVQVRSIIEHAWAESDHELRYKSGIKLSNSVARRFAALAAMLEVVDREFDQISAEVVELTKLYSSEYSKHEHMDDDFDSARLIGYLAVRRSYAKRLGPPGLVLSFRLASECVKALNTIGMRNATALEQALEDPQLLTLLRDYADRRNVEPEEVSGLVIIASVVGRIDIGLLDRFPSLADVVVRAVISES
jgi:putative GTP pyrophosphokinase